MAHRIGIVGLGKIAQDQHVPVIAADPAFELAAVSSTRGLTTGGVPGFRTLGEMLTAVPKLDAVAICTPPQARYELAREALLAGKHVLLEKPPTATISELAHLRTVAEQAGRVLFTTWHSQYNAAVEECARRLSAQAVTRLFVDWKEDVRKWHPGQRWIWDAGGFGVFDPGINALSIVTRILPQPAFLRAAELSFPANCDAPIAASLSFGGSDMRAEFDWRQDGGEVWEITVGTASGQTLKLAAGGTRLEVDGDTVVEAASAEYAGIYRRFDDLLTQGISLVDPAPLWLVAEAFMLGRRVVVEPFHDTPQAQAG